ncbi:nucleoside diphosphate-linked moiety X motif 8-like isoform X2 [Octopus vulgaris]|uniref:Nucleoside diphosphate-linked moiety X motif 8-like isoform X2 n=1 Tax=Octopus vulgaris TaxID=6645 RepID=A0AA36AXG7_OCTVU|nr:nucleoside diphosphate-linked moiety X motif 8-like isoform X2 [Octopus vulgaris]
MKEVTLKNVLLVDMSDKQMLKAFSTQENKPTFICSFFTLLPVISEMKVHCQKYLLLYPRCCKRLKQFCDQHITNFRQIHNASAARNPSSFKFTKYGFPNSHWFPIKQKQLQGPQHNQLRYLSDVPCKFNDLVSSANKQRTQKSMQLVKPVRNLPLKKGFKRAAILIPMCMIDGQLSLLLTLRSIHLKNHRGEVSFPGGMMDRSDADLTVTALRETHEEIGLDPKLIDVWGTMHPLSNSAASREVTPVVGFGGDINLNSLHINSNEVEKVFFTTIKDLCDPNNQQTTQFRTDGPKTSHDLGETVQGSLVAWEAVGGCNSQKTWCSQAHNSVLI